MALALIAPSVLFFSQLGRPRRLVAALSAFFLVTIFWALNAQFSTSLDEEFGGGYGWSGTRVALMAMVEGPLIGLVAAAFTFGFAHANAFQSAVRTSLENAANG